MKRAAFLSFDWDHEVMSLYYEGMQACLEQRRDTALVIFNAYGEHEGLEAGVWALDLFSLCDVDSFDGFLIQGNRTWVPDERQRVADELRAMGKPVVSVGYELEGTCYVGTDNYQAEYNLVSRVLADHGCRRPAFVNGLATSVEAQARKQGFVDACAAAGLVDPPIYQASWMMSEGIKAAESMLADRDHLPDAVFCCNDELAVGVQETFQAAGLRIPEDVCITGFDNYDIVFKAQPHVTTIDRNYRAIGQAAMETLAALMDGEERPTHVMSPVRQILCESSGYPYDPRYTEGLAGDLLDMEQAHRQFLKLLATFHPALLEAQTMPQIMDVCERFMPEIRCREVCLMLNDAFLESDVLAKRVPYGSTLSLMAYRGQLVVSTCDGRHVYANLSVRELLTPQYVNEPTVYMVHPIRHEAVCIGVLITRGVSPSYRRGYLTAALTLLGGFIESGYRQAVLQRANVRLDDLYVHDQLTGLFNRFGLNRFGTIAYEHLLRDFDEAYFIFIDIDDMKLINDRIGHDAGDQSIRDAAEVITQSIEGENAFAMRYGGDEFLLICRRNIISVMQDKLAALKERCARPYDLQLSMGGICVTAGEHLPLMEAIERADACMYEVKKARKVGRR